MAKKKRKDANEEALRQTRKEILLARKHAQQTRRIRLAMAGVGGLLLLVLAIGVADLLVVSPNRPVAVVSGEEIKFRDWEDRVVYERAQRILILENQLQAFGGDVGFVQQVSGQMMLELQNADELGQNVLDEMVNEKVVEQLADARGIKVTEADIDKELGESFNYFGGELPTATSTATGTAVPTPSLTPVPTRVITELLPTSTPFPTSVPGPSRTPGPTATPVSRESFEGQLGDLYQNFAGYGVSQETFRAVVRARLLQRRLADALAEENELPLEAMQASIFYLSFADEEAATVGLSLVEEMGYLTVWNTLRTAPSEIDSSGTALELLWRTQDSIAASLGESVAQEAFSMPTSEPSGVLTQTVSAEDIRYYIIQVSGRETRPLTASAFEQRKAELLASVVDQQLAGNLETTNFWRSRVPSQPALDPKFFAAPTATPLPAVPEVVPTAEEVP